MMIMEGCNMFKTESHGNGSWLKDLILGGAGLKLAVWSSWHHTWVMFVGPWPAIWGLSTLLLPEIWLPIARAKYPEGSNLDSRIWFWVGPEGRRLFGSLATTQGPCLVDPVWLSEPSANFCFMGIGCPYQGLTIPWGGILAQGFDLGWDRREVGCLEFWAPHTGKCSVDPGWVSKPWANFCCTWIGCPYQGLTIPWGGILVQGFYLGWHWREVGCLEVLPPHTGHVC